VVFEDGVFVEYYVVNEINVLMIGNVYFGEVVIILGDVVC